MKGLLVFPLSTSILLGGLLGFSSPTYSEIAPQALSETAAFISRLEGCPQSPSPSALKPILGTGQFCFLSSASRQDFLYKTYWVPMELDKLPTPIAISLLDMAVSMGKPYTTSFWIENQAEILALSSDKQLSALLNKRRSLFKAFPAEVQSGLNNRVNRLESWLLQTGL